MKKSSSKQTYALQHGKSAVKAKIQAKLKKNASVSAAKVITRPKKQTSFKMPQTIASPAQSASAPTEKLFAGFKAKLHYQNGKVSVSSDIRYVTEKTDPYITLKNVGPQGQDVHKELVGYNRGAETWFDDKGNPIQKTDVRKVQVLPDGSTKEVHIQKADDVTVEPIDADIPQNFLPYSFLEVWADDENDEDGLRKMASDLIANNKVGGIKQFSSTGKMYMGFLRPIMSKDGSKFGIEIMLSENRRQKKRWMLAEAGPSGASPKKAKASAPVVPTLF